MELANSNPVKYFLGSANTTKRGNDQHSAGTRSWNTGEKRIAEEKRELSLAVVLTFTVLMFLLTHTPRLVYIFFFSFYTQLKSKFLANLFFFK